MESLGTLSHDVLVDRVADRVADGKVLGLVRQMLTAGVLRDGLFEPTITGTPQGGVADAYAAKYPKAVAKIVEDAETLLAFFDFPAEHWIHLKTTNRSSPPSPRCGSGRR